MQTPSVLVPALDRLRYALQPIVDAKTGAVRGREALLRGASDAGFPSVHALLDAAWDSGSLGGLEALLWEKALDRFASLPDAGGELLYYNLDTRLLGLDASAPRRAREAAEKAGVAPSSVLLEVSERHAFGDWTLLQRTLDAYRSEGFGLALDDFGSGFSGLQLFYYAEPRCVKIDRFFVDGIAESPRKRIFVSQIVSMTSLMDVLVVAEGVETEQDARVCAELGCSLAQGYWYAKPDLPYDAGAEAAEPFPFPRWFSAAPGVPAWSMEAIS